MLCSVCYAYDLIQCMRVALVCQHGYLFNREIVVAR